MGEATRRELESRLTWLEEEMGYVWNSKLNAFVNVDLELELGRSDPRLKAPISAGFVRKRLSFGTFQRAVKILVDRSRKARAAKGP